jgi:adenylate cyclase
MNAFIETPDGSRIALESNCYFGRSHVNTVQLQAPGASRRHALIHGQHAESGTEYWLADLGSANGTLCNSRRVTLPVRLKDGDTISIVGENFIFHRTDDAPNTNSPFQTTLSADTVKVRARTPSWLLMLDIKGFTTLSCQMDADTLGPKIGQWMRQTRDAIEATGGVVDKFLGDAVFVYWKADADTAARVATTVRQLMTIQKQRDPDFRIVIHFGEATLEGGAGGADNLSGPDVIKVFRMEKVCSKLSGDSILSQEAATGLAGELDCDALGSFPLDGFTGKFELFGLRG